MSRLPIPATKQRIALACLAAFILPGLGHVLLGRWGRGVLLCLVILLMFLLGFQMEGHLFRPVGREWLTWFFSFLDAGIGLPYLVCWVADWGFEVTPDQAAKLTFEYGNNFLCVAGALNMLAAMDAFDIGIGRKA
ncbi:MAG: DUF6677 family protein [Blastocatellia bacterium]